MKTSQSDSCPFRETAIYSAPWMRDDQRYSRSQDVRGFSGYTGGQNANRYLSFFLLTG